MNVDVLSPRTTVGVLFRQAQQHGDRILLRYHRGGRWQEMDWSEFSQLVERLAAQLVNAGIGFGERVALMSENRPEWLICDFAIQAAGAVTIPIYPSLNQGSAENLLMHSQASFGFFADRNFQSSLSISQIDIDEQLPDWLSSSPPASALTEVEIRCRKLQPDDLATVVYTSGTTDEPKGVMLAHRNLIDSAHCSLEVFQISDKDVALSILPYAHVLERVNGISIGLIGGGVICISRGPKWFAEDLLACQPSVLIAVPLLYEKIYHRLQSYLEKLFIGTRILLNFACRVGQLRRNCLLAPLNLLTDRLVLKLLRERLVGKRMRFLITGGAAQSTKVEEFFWSIGLPLLQGWGMTETSSAVTVNTIKAHRVGSVGQPLPKVKLKIAEQGEIWVNSPGNMLGYFRDPEASAKAIFGKWLKTGDVGHLDSSGFLYLTDRLKELIKTSTGKYISPQQLENQLQLAPLIERAVVVGDRRPYIVALLVPNWKVVNEELLLSGSPSELIHNQQLIEAVGQSVSQLNSRLQSWERIRSFSLLDEDLSETELTPTLKLRRRVINEKYQSVIDQLYEASDG